MKIEIDDSTLVGVTLVISLACVICASLLYHFARAAIGG